MGLRVVPSLSGRIQSCARELICIVRPEVVRPEVVVVGVDEEEESESDFPDIKLDERLEGFDEMIYGKW